MVYVDFFWDAIPSDGDVEIDSCYELIRRARGYQQKSLSPRDYEASVGLLCDYDPTTRCEDVLDASLPTYGRGILPHEMEDRVVGVVGLVNDEQVGVDDDFLSHAFVDNNEVFMSRESGREGRSHERAHHEKRQHQPPNNPPPHVPVHTRPKRLNE